MIEKSLEPMAIVSSNFSTSFKNHNSDQFYKLHNPFFKSFSRQRGTMVMRSNITMVLMWYTWESLHEKQKKLTAIFPLGCRFIVKMRCASSTGNSGAGLNEGLFKQKVFLLPEEKVYFK